MNYVLIKSKEGAFKFLISEDACEFVTSEYISRYADVIAEYTRIAADAIEAISRDPLCEMAETKDIFEKAKKFRVNLAEFISYARPLGIPFDLQDVDAFMLSSRSENNFNLVIEI